MAAGTLANVSGWASSHGEAHPLRSRDSYMTTIVAGFALALLLPGQPPQEAVRVDIDGVSRELRRNIRAHLSLYQRRADAELPESTIRALHDRAPREIREALQPFGYYRPEIEGELTRRPARWRARYLVRPGDPVRYVSVDVAITGDGSDDPVLQDVLPLARIQPGEPLRHPAWDRSKQTLLNQAASRGYLDARISRSRIEVDTAALTARAVLHVATGPRYRFGPVRFRDTPLQRWVLQRYVTIEPGTPFSLDRLLETQRLLRSSDYFRFIQVEPLRDEAVGLQVPIEVGLETRPRTQYTVGAGYGTDTGARIRGSGQRRWLNDRGHRVQGEARASLQTQALQAQYVIPLAGGAADRLAASTVFQHESFQGLESQLILGRGEWDHGRAGWREVLSIRLQEEWYRDADVSRNSTLLIPEIAWSRVRGEDVLYPRDGYRLALGLSGASDAVVSDVTFAKATADLTLARGLHRTGRLLARLNLGTTLVDDLRDMPVSLRLYAGGDRSVRGFAYRSIGPVDVDGTVTGGRHRVVASLELGQQVYGPVGMAVFTDGGNVFATADAITPENAEYSAGVGVRWRSPIGPVRLDVAWPLSRPGQPPRFHFVVGGTL